MLLRIFHSGYFINIFMFLLISILLWMPAFLHPPAAFSSTGLGIGFEQLAKLIHLSSQLTVGFAFAILLVQAIVFNNVLVENPIFSKSVFLPALIYIILMSHNPDLLTLHPLLIANFFLVFSLKNLYNTYEKPEAFRESFNASFWISAASLFYYPAIFLIFFIWASFLIFRINSWREWLISVIGLGMPYLFLGIIFFLTGNLHFFVSYYVEGISWLGLTFHFNLQDYIFWPVFLLLLLIAYYKFNLERAEKTINIRKSFAVVNALLLISVISLIYNGFNAYLQEYLIFPAAAIVIAFYFIEARRKFFAELFFAFLLIAVVIIKFL